MATRLLQAVPELDYPAGTLNPGPSVSSDGSNCVEVHGL